MKIGRLALVIQDGPQSDYRTHAEDYLAETRAVTKADTLHLKLALGGGACVLITKNDRAGDSLDLRSRVRPGEISPTP